MKPQTIKAAVSYKAGQALKLESVNLDPPKEDEVKVKVAACAICHSDIFYIDGAWGEQAPAVYGHEVAGWISEVGQNVNSVKVGDAVIVTLIRYCGHCYFCQRGEPAMCSSSFALDAETRLHTLDGAPLIQGLKTGGFAEYAVVHHSQVIPIKEHIPLQHAALLACGVITGLGAVTNTAKVPFGSSVVIIGAGGVGLNSIQGAALSGAQPIIAIDLAESKLEAAKTFGATHTINPTQTDTRNAVLELTQGRGADFVFITAGSGKAIDLGLTLMRRGGSLVVVGMPPNGVKTEIELGYLASDSQRILGSKMGSAQPTVDLPNMLGLYQQGRLKLAELVTGCYPLAQINEALEAVKRGDALRNVIIFDNAANSNAE